MTTLPLVSTVHVKVHQGCPNYHLHAHGHAPLVASYSCRNTPVGRTFAGRHQAMWVNEGWGGRLQCSSSLGLSTGAGAASTGQPITCAIGLQLQRHVNGFMITIPAAWR